MDALTSATKKNIFNYGDDSGKDEEIKVLADEDSDDDAPAFGVPKTRKKVSNKDGISQQAFILK